MESFAFLLILVPLALIALPIIAIVTANARSRELRDQIFDLTKRVWNLESQLSRLAAEHAAEAAVRASLTTERPQGRSDEELEAQRPAQSPVAGRVEIAAPIEPLVRSSEPAEVYPVPAVPPEIVPPAESITPVAERSVPPLVWPSEREPLDGTPDAPRQDVADHPDARQQVFSLEERLGKNWLNKLGIASVVIGLAFFLAYKLQTWGPAGKVLCGYAVSAVLLAGGVWLERKVTYRIFARAGIGGGWALAYFTTFAMHHIAAARVLDSLVADLMLMLLVAAGMVAHSLRYRSQTVTGLAFLLGFATLLTSNLQAWNGSVVFSLVASAILAIALVAVTTARHWARLEIAGLAAVYLTHFVWLTQVLPSDRLTFSEFWPSTLLILFYWAIFRAAYVLRSPVDHEEETLSSLAAVLNSCGVLGLLKYQSAHPEWAFWALAALGVVEMGLAFFVRPRRRQAFVVLSTIAVVLLVSSVPFKFHGVSWPILWLIQAHVLALCGLRLDEPVFRRLGLLTGVVTGAVLAVREVVPLILARMESRDGGAHVSLTVALALAALLYWVHAEVYPRRWPEITKSDFEAVVLGVTSWLGVAAAAAVIWVSVPPLWTPVGWLILMLLLGLAADWVKAASLAGQADALAIMALMRYAAQEMWSTTTADRRAPLLLGVALLYAGMRRITVPEGMAAYVAPAYSWAATLLLAYVAAVQCSAIALGPVWVLLGVALFEIGRATRKGFLRWQGFLLVAFAFGRYFFVNLPDAFGNFGLGQSTAPFADHFSMTHSLLLEALVLAAAGYFLLERTRDAYAPEHVAGVIADVLGTLGVAVWFALRFPSYWVPVQGGDAWVTDIWAGMALVLLALAWLLPRRTFAVQAECLAVAVFVRGVVVDLSAGSPDGFWHGPLYRISVASLILLATLPFAFQLREAEFWANSRARLPLPAAGIFSRPEQWFFFVPFTLMIIALAFKLSSGHITIAWSLMGLIVFGFALIVGERSYRLAGLGLLLVSMAKIILVDVWALSVPDRYTTLIVLGLALLAVSFLYTRFSATIRKLL
jgi:Predicted membrane protein (DUF2339)